MKRSISLLLLLPFFAFSQAPDGYYDGTQSLTGYALKSKLHEIVSQKNINWNYSDLTPFFGLTDLDRYYDHDASNDSILLDIYSEIPTGPDAYEYTVSNLVGSANAEGQGWNREHMMPQSTYDSNYPMYSDMFYIIPTDARINQLRSNYPYGKAGSTTFYNFTNTSRIGNNATPGSGYTGRVYEPIDEFKGDIARSLLYFAMRYEGKLNAFNYYNGTSAANDKSPLDGTEEKAFEDWYVAMLLQWNAQDPVSQREVDRNNAVYLLQKNRNPFIDHPEWVNMIWNQTPDGVIPQAPQNLSIQKNSAYFVNLNWSPSAESDVLGYRIYQNGVYVATTKSTNISIDHLSPGTVYNFTVRAYDNGYLESADSNIASETTLESDVFASDLMITKYLEGTADNKAIEITNKTGHPVNLNKYRLSIQLTSASNYYFPAPYELEGTVANNETFVVLNPRSDFSCITNEQAKFVTAAPQMTFNGSQYVELRYASTTVDAIGLRGTNNYESLGDVSLYRLPSVTQPSTTFSLSQWQTYPVDYCENIGSLASTDVLVNNDAKYAVYPNPVVTDSFFVKGKNLANVKKVSVFDLSGKLVLEQNAPFKNKNSVNVQHLKTGIYVVTIDGQSVKITKK